jgi:MoxR-like ATPase
MVTVIEINERDYIMNIEKNATIVVNNSSFRFTQERVQDVKSIVGAYPKRVNFTIQEIKKACGKIPSWVRTKKYDFYDGSKYNLKPVIENYNRYSVVTQLPVENKQQPVVEAITNVVAETAVIPEQLKTYVPFGHFKDVKEIIKSKIFFPVFVTGLSGNGKTLMIEQVCAQLKRELYRVNITIETDEDDLMGGHTLINGNMTYREGPVITAMRSGAVLLLDEVDLGSNKLMCLQSVLEGKGYLIKKTGEWVQPAEGFTILATANTKGQGSEDGKFIGTQIMNEAMLERFAVAMEQQYPPASTERKILNKEFELSGMNETEFVTKLVDWAEIIRKTYYEGAIDDVITTRRLVHIVNAYKMFGDRLKSIQMCISRFDAETRDAVLDLYTKVDEGVDLNEGEENG